jgi:hypothetical protein
MLRAISQFLWTFSMALSHTSSSSFCVRLNLNSVHTCQWIKWKIASPIWNLQHPATSQSNRALFGWTPLLQTRHLLQVKISHHDKAPPIKTKVKPSFFQRNLLSQISLIQSLMQLTILTHSFTVSPLHPSWILPSPISKKYWTLPLQPSPCNLRTSYHTGPKPTA